MSITYVEDLDGNKVCIADISNTGEVTNINYDMSLNFKIPTILDIESTIDLRYNIANSRAVETWTNFKDGRKVKILTEFFVGKIEENFMNAALNTIYSLGLGTDIPSGNAWPPAGTDTSSGQIPNPRDSTRYINKDIYVVGYYIGRYENTDNANIILVLFDKGELIHKLPWDGPFPLTRLLGANWEDETEEIEAYPDESEEDGGYGDKDLTSDTIDLPDLPAVTGLTSNFITAYAPSNVQLNQLANFMWTSDFLDNFKKLWSNPMENLVSLAIMPFNVSTSGSGTVVIGYWLTDVTMPKITQQFQEIDCGSLKIGKFYNSFLDYAPYTKINIYLPFIGIRQLKVDEIMGKTLSVKYRVDIISGTCVAYILVNNSIFYQFNGNCATTIPITNADYSNLINASLQSTSGVITMGAGIMGGASIVAGAGASMLAGGMIDTVTSMKPDINKSGNMSGSSGMMGVKTPFLMTEIPRQSWAKDNNKFKGIPSNVSSKLSVLKGYTVVDKINISDINATEREMIEIENLLKQGVIL